MDDYLRSIYYEPGHYASFSSAKRLYYAARGRFPQLTEQYVKNFLASQPTYTKHRQTVRNFPRNRMKSSGPGEHWQADLCDLKAFKTTNDNYTFILTVIDIFSKQAFAAPIKTKSGADVAAAFDEIFKFEAPGNLMTDHGKEFTNATVQDIFKKYQVNHFTSNNQTTKAAVCERFNRSLKNRMFKYFTANKTKRWINILPKLVDSYNRSYHSAIKMAPIAVTADNASKVFRNLYGVNDRLELQGLKNVRNNVQVGDTVVSSLLPTAFSRGFNPTWSDRLLTVAKVHNKNIPIYSVKGAGNKTLRVRFYGRELQKVRQ